MNTLRPINRTKAQARRYYDSISRIYDALTAGEADHIQRGADLLALQPGESLLEIGCGTGRALRWFADTAPGVSRLVGLDLSHRMLRHSATKRFTPRPGFVQGDGTHLPLQDSCFDAVFITFTLELFTKQDIHSVLAECKRVLKPTGRLGVVALSGSPRTVSVKLYEFFHRLFPVAVDCRPIPLTDLLETHGFQPITAEKGLNWGLPILLTVSIPRQSADPSTHQEGKSSHARTTGS